MTILPEVSEHNPGPLFSKSLSNNIDFLNSAPGVVFRNLQSDLKVYGQNELIWHDTAMRSTDCFCLVGFLMNVLFPHPSTREAMIRMERKDVCEWRVDSTESRMKESTQCDIIQSMLSWKYKIILRLGYTN